MSKIDPSLSHFINEFEKVERYGPGLYLSRVASTLSPSEDFTTRNTHERCSTTTINHLVQRVFESLRISPWSDSKELVQKKADLLQRLGDALDAYSARVSFSVQNRLWFQISSLILPKCWFSYLVGMFGLDSEGRSHAIEALTQTVHNAAYAMAQKARAFPIPGALTPLRLSDSVRLGSRSMLMHDNLRRCGAQEAFTDIGTTRYMNITGNTVNFHDQPIVSLGADTFGREAVLIDPKDPELQPVYERFESLMLSLESREFYALPEYERMRRIFEKCKNFLKHEIFNRNPVDVERVVGSVCANWRGTRVAALAHTPAVPITYFIRKHLGVCRHHAALGCYVISRFRAEHPGTPGHPCVFPEGRIHLSRDLLTLGFRPMSHAWMNYTTDDRHHAYHMDTLWSLWGDLSLPADVTRCIGRYRCTQADMQREADRYLKPTT